MPRKNFTQQQRWRLLIEDIVTGLVLSSTSTKTFIIQSMEQMSTRRKMQSENCKPNNNILQGCCVILFLAKIAVMGPDPYCFSWNMQKIALFYYCDFLVFFPCIYILRSFSNFSWFLQFFFQIVSRDLFNFLFFLKISNNNIDDVIYNLYI